MESVLKISLGSNLFSISELGNLKKDDVAMSDQIAGKPVELLWNDNLVAFGEIVVIDKLMGFRIKSFEVRKESVVPFYRKEKLIDVIEARIIFSEKKVDFDELLVIKEHSVIIFGDFIDEIEARLVIGKETIARGKICIYQENMGIQMTETCFPQNLFIDQYPYKSTGNIIKSERKNKQVKLYDFRRPDKFSFIQLSNMMKLHEIFIDNAVFNMGSHDIKARIKSIDQLAYFELYDVIINSKMDVAKFDNGFYKAPIENDLELRSTPNKMAEEFKASFRKFINTRNEMLYDKNQEDKYNFCIMMIYKDENPLLEKSTFEISFKKAWETITHIEPEILKKDIGYEMAVSLLPKYDMICIVEIEVEIGMDKKTFSLVYPYITIENVLANLSKKIF